MSNTQTLRQLENIYSFSEFDVSGNEQPMMNYKGKVCLIVNITGKDPNAENFFKQIYILNSQFKKKGLSILVFPCCQFGTQENIDDLLVHIKNLGYDFGTIFQQTQVSLKYYWLLLNSIPKYRIILFDLGKWQQMSRSLQIP